MKHITSVLILPLLLVMSATALAQTARQQAKQALPLMPLQKAPGTTAMPLELLPVEGEEAPPAETQPADEETALKMAEATRLAKLYKALPPDQQEHMRAVYDAQDIDLLALIAMAQGPDANKQPLLPLISRKNFKRTPQAVLAARTKLGLEENQKPPADLPPGQVGEWLHLHVMAGEWGQLQWFLADRAGDEAEGIYSHIIQSTNRGDPMLLPEEVLALANAAPEGTEESPSPTNWQVDILGKLLKQSSERSSTGPMLAQLKAGTRFFGGTEPDNQARTAALLTRAGLSDHALQYLPSLEQAREEGNGRDLLVHGLYHADRDETISAWELFGEVALIEDEDFKLRQEALRESVKGLTDVPEAQATEWLTRVFADEQLAPAALEVIALDAMGTRQAESVQRRTCPCHSGHEISRRHASEFRTREIGSDPRPPADADDRSGGRSRDRGTNETRCTWSTTWTLDHDAGLPR